MKYVRKDNDGITLIVLVITIIVLIILAGVAISMLSGENGILNKAAYAKFATEIKTIEEQVTIASMGEGIQYSGKINDILKTENEYNDKLLVEEGELKYVSDNVSQQEEEWLIQLGIEPASSYFTIEYETFEGTEIATQTVKSGELVVKPENPIKAGYEFIEWYYVKIEGTDENVVYTEEIFDFNTQITQNYVLYARYSNEAIIRAYNQNEAFWKEEYREKITSIQFIKDEISVPTDAIDLGDVKKDENCSEIRAYLEDDETGTGNYQLTIVSPQTIYANPNMYLFFYKFSNLESINFSNFNTSKVTNMCRTFADCKKITSIDLSGFDTRNVTNMDSSFKGCTNLKEIDISSFDTNKLNSMYSTFMDCEKLEKIVLNNINTSNVTNMGQLFYNCATLTEINLSNFNTSKVTNMASMFYNCQGLENIDVTSFDTSNVINMNLMYNSCKKIKKLDLSNFVTSKVTTMYYMFGFCSTLTDLNVSSFDTSNVTNMYRMFNACASIEFIDLSNFRTSKVITMYGMFANTPNLKQVNLKNFDVSNVTSFDSMFDSRYVNIKVITNKTTANWITKKFTFIKNIDIV